MAGAAGGQDGEGAAEAEAEGGGGVADAGNGSHGVALNAFGSGERSDSSMRPVLEIWGEEFKRRKGRWKLARAGDGEEGFARAEVASWSSSLAPVIFEEERRDQ